MRWGTAWCLLLVGCGSAPVVKPAPAATIMPPMAPKVVWPEATACRYGLTGAELPIVTDEGAYGEPMGAFAGGKLLVPYIPEDHDSRELWARIVDRDSRQVGPRFQVTPSYDNRHYGTSVTEAPKYAVSSLGDRFVVIWHLDRTWTGRFVGLDGSLGATVTFPGSEDWPADLIKAGDHDVAAWSDTVDSDHCTVSFAEYSTDLEPLGTPAKFDLGAGCVGAHRAQRVGDEIWVVIEADDLTENAKRLRVLLVRADLHGRRLDQAPLDITSSRLDATRAQLLPSPHGALALWSHPYNYDDPAGAYAVQLDHEGHPLGPASKLGKLPDVSIGIELDVARGRPVVRDHASTVAAVDWNGAVLAAPSTLAPFTRNAAWITTDGDPWLLWRDYRRGRDELFAAPVGCDGAVPPAPPRQLAPLVTTKAVDTTLPKLAHACKAPRFTSDTAVGQTPYVQQPGLVVHGGELWATWLDSNNYMLRRVGAKNLVPIGAQTVLVPKVQSGQLLANGTAASVLYKHGLDLMAAALHADGTVDTTTIAALPLPNVRVNDFFGLANGDVVWSAGTYSFLEARKIQVGASPAPSPLVDVSSPNEGLGQNPRVAATPDGWIAAWWETAGNELVVARSRNGALVWVARVPVRNGARLPTLGVVGEQIFAVVDDGQAPRYVRFTLDGARLDDVPIPGFVRVAESLLSDRGLATISQSGKKVCLRMFGLDGKPLTAQAACSDAGVANEMEHSGPPPLAWNGSVLHWLAPVGSPDFSTLHLTSWSCE